MSGPEYTELPERAAKILENFLPPDEKIGERMQYFAHVQPRAGDQEGDTEIIDGVTFTHHFVDAPGDYETVRWHYVECGNKDAEKIVFLHGIPDSWYEWCHQMAAFAREYHCIGVDLKGYGQSDKKGGNYQHEAVSEQLWAMLQQIGVKQFNVITHDRGTVQADFIAANHPESVLRYGRGEQHLYNFHPALAPQGDLFMDAPYNGMLDDPKYTVLWGYTWLTLRPIPDAEMERVIQEFSYEGIRKAVPRYFSSSTFRQEWLARRNRLLGAWKCPVMILQGYDSKTQPREFYEGVEQHIPNARSVEVRYIPGGHFWTKESPKESIEAIRELLKM